MSELGNTTVSLARENHDIFYSPKWLDYNLKHLLFQKFAMRIEMPKNVGKSITFQAWNPPAKQLAPVPLVEGVTPDSKKMSKKEITTQLVWFGNYIETTDQLETVFEDANNLESGKNKFLGVMQSEEMDTAMFNILVGGTNVIYANGVASRSLVDTALSIGDLHIASRTLKNGLDGRAGMPITEMLSSDGNFGTTDIEPSFVCIICPDLEYDVRSLPGFVPTSAYGGGGGNSRIDISEFGKVDNFRFLVTTNYSYWADAGAAASGKNVLSTSGTDTDVYPIIILSQDAYAQIPLTGEQGAMLIRKGLGSSGTNDPLNQRATVGYRNPFAGLICYQERIVRIEVGATKQPGL